MTDLRTILDNLPADKRKLLMLAFEDDKSCHVELENGYYVGVNWPPGPGLEVLETQGVWSLGRIT